MTETKVETVRLGLIGDNIARSQSPRLHELAGRLTGIPVSYERLIPKERGEDFEAVFASAREAGFRGLNITYPYKERVVPLLTVPDPEVAVLGAVNTVVFAPTTGPLGYNTDWSGFIAGYRRAFGDRPPGPVAMVGAGGVGKAVAFGLLSLGLERLTIVERDLPKAEALAEALKTAAPALDVRVTGDVDRGPPTQPVSSTAPRSAWWATRARPSRARSWPARNGPLMPSTPRSTPSSSPRRQPRGLPW